MQQSWIRTDKNSDFPIQNIPFGIANVETKFYAVTRIGDYVINLSELHRKGYFIGIELPTGIFENNFLNDYIALGKPVTRQVRKKIQSIFDSDSTDGLKENNLDRGQILMHFDQVRLNIPICIGDYTDFYSSEHHAYNVGSMFRDPKNALMPNWKHLPVGYHGRASSIVVSGTDFHRPKGQVKSNSATNPSLEPSQGLDFELEMAFVIGKPTKVGEAVHTKNADEHIFGFCIYNDWSARDIQKWEYVPLGPFLGKNFASHISPWIVTMEALEPFKTSGSIQNPKVLPYLEYEGKYHYDIELEVYIQPSGGIPQKISTSNFKYIYWNVLQLLAHHTINGCNLNVGDLMASGTISGSEPSQFGSMLEITWNGTKPIKLNNNTERKFIEDGDTIIMKAYGERNGLRIGFGEVQSKVLPAK